MSVTGATTRNDYIASSGQTVFSYTFQILLGSDLKVIKNGTPIALGSDYTVSGVGDADGGEITLTSSASSGDTLSILLDMPFDRTTQYQEAGDFLASDVNGDFDKAYVALNQLQTDIARAMTLQDKDPTVSLDLPIKADRASKYLGFDANGSPSTYPVPSGDGIASVYKPSFTGAASRSLQARLEDYVSVADFGAVGDGVTDDTAALQAAFAYGISTRSKIFLEGKTYLYSDLLATVSDAVEIQGSGVGTILLKDNSYTGAAFEVYNTFGILGEFYPNSSGDDEHVADTSRLLSPSFSNFSIVGKSREFGGHGFEFKDRNDMVRITDVNVFNLAGSAIRFTGTFGNLRESHFTRMQIRMCGTSDHPAVDLEMPTLSNTRASTATVGGKTQVTLSGTGDDFSSFELERPRIRIEGTRNDGGAVEWTVESKISDTVVELDVNITDTNPETGEPYGQNVINQPCVFYRDVDGLNHIVFTDCQIVGCFGTFLYISHSRVNFFRRLVFNNLMVHGSSQKDVAGGPAGDLIIIEGGTGSVDFRGLRINTPEVDPDTSVKYAGIRIKKGKILEDIPDRIWINDLDMLNLIDNGDAMFVIENVKNLSVNGTVAASRNSGKELKVLADSVEEAIDYNVIAGTSKNIRNRGAQPAFDIDSSVANKVFITENQRRDNNVSEDDFREITSDINETASISTTLFSREYRGNIVKTFPIGSASDAGAEWNTSEGKVAYIPGRQMGGTTLGTWTASSTSGEYYLATTADTRLTDVVQVIEDNYMIYNEGVLGSLSNGEYKVGDNDSLGYNTLYIKPLSPSAPGTFGDTDIRYRQTSDGTTSRVTRRFFYGGDLPDTGYYYNGDVFYDFTPTSVTGDPVAWICRVRGYGNPTSSPAGTAQWEIFGVIDG